jgi:uncharacterized protein YfaS (alpha-2-macroglobulin family)
MYDVGDVARIDVTVKNASGALADPATLVARTKRPDGVVTVYTYGVDPQWSRLSTGTYTLDISLSVSGVWWYRIETTGANVVGAEESSVTVKPSQVLP